VRRDPAAPVKVAVVTAVTPFGAGLHRDLAAGLAPAIRRAGHAAETVLVPCADDADADGQRKLFEALALDGCDQIVALRPPAHLVRHQRLAVWLPGCPDQSGPQGAGPHGSGPQGSGPQEADRAALMRAQRVFAATAAAAADWRQQIGRDVEVLSPPTPVAEGPGQAGTVWATPDRLDALLAAMRLIAAPLRLEVETGGDPLVALRMRLHAARWPEQAAMPAAPADVLVCLAADDDRTMPVMDRAAASGRGCIVASDCAAARGRSVLAVDPSDPAAIADALSRAGRSPAPADRLSDRLSDRPSWAEIVATLLAA
jgi:hypothetical protein